MRGWAWIVIALVVGPCLATGSAAAELQFRAAELELIDGQGLAGQLAGETETHFIVYSPLGGSILRLSQGPRACGDN